MILFSVSSYGYMAGTLLKLCSIKRGDFSINRFPNQELYIIVRVKTAFCADTIALRKELEAEPIEPISAIPLMQRKLKEVDRDARAIY